MDDKISVGNLVQEYYSFPTQENALKIINFLSNFPEEPCSEYWNSSRIPEIICFFDEYIFSKSSLTKEDKFLVSGFFLDLDGLANYVCDAAVQNGMEEFMEFILKTKLRDELKLSYAIKDGHFDLIKRMYEEGFEWSEDCDKIWLEENQYLRETILKFISDHIESWKDGSFYTVIKPAKRD